MSFNDISRDIFDQAISELENETDAHPAQPAPQSVTPPVEQTSSAQPRPQVQQPPQQPEEKSWWQRGADMWKSVGAGVGKAGIETKDFLFGEPAEEDKSQFRKDWEQRSKQLADDSMANSLAMGGGQIVTGLIGAGKIMAPVKAAKWFKAGGKVAQAGFEVARGATAGAVVIDPHEERLSNLVESFPDLQNPVTDYLAAKPDDSAAEGRFKNALESIGADFALLGAVKAIKLLRMGNQKAADQEIAKLANYEADTILKGAEESGGLALPSDAKAAGKAIETPPAPNSINMSDGLPSVETPASSAPRVKDELSAPVSSSPTVDQLAPKQEVTVNKAHYAPAVEVSEASLSSILKSTDDNLKAIQQHGSRQAAIDAGHSFGEKTDLPWQKLRSTEEVSTFIDNAANVLKTQMDNVKSGDILSDAKVRQMVDARAELFGEDPSMILGQLAKAGQDAGNMAANMEASYLIANRMFTDAYDLATKIRTGDLTVFGGDLSKATGELKARLMASSDLLASARSMSSNSGRALRRMRGQHRISQADIDTLKSMDGDKLADILFQTKGDPKKLAQVANPTFLRRVTDEATFSLTNSLLWMWPTHLVNTTSNAMMLVGRPTEKLIGSFALGPKAGGSVLRERAIREYSYTMASLGDGWQALVDAFKKGDSILNPHNTELFNAGSTTQTAQSAMQLKPVRGIGDIVENAAKLLTYRNIVGLPTRALGASDEFFKTLRYRSYVQAEAAAKATELGYTGNEFRKFVQAELEKSIDPATGRALNERALQEAQTTTFQQELLSGTVGATVQQARNRHPALTFVLPFVKTPINVLRYSVKMTPGLNLVQKEFREAIAGRMGEEAKAHAMGQMALGSVFMGLSASLALNGKITGSGPTDAKILKELKASGWQPYSFVIDNDDGSKTYLPIGRLDPAGLAFSTVADLVQALQADPEGTAVDGGIGVLGMALAKSFSDRTFLQNIHQTLSALTDQSGKKGETYLASLAGNTVPLSSAMRGANPDPYLREARGFVDTMLKNIPGYSATLPPSRNAFGEPIVRHVGISSRMEGDFVEAENNRIMLETGHSVSKVSPEFQGLDLRDITLASGQNAYDRLQELGAQIPGQHSLKKLLANNIRSNAYKDMPDGEPGVSGTRINRLAVVAQKYREAAKKYLLTENKELQQLVRQRQREAQGAMVENRKQRLQGESSPATAILNAIAN